MSPAGRPEIGTPVNIRLGDDLLAQVDQFAQVESVSRAEAIRQLVQRGLRRRLQINPQPLRVVKGRRNEPVTEYDLMQSVRCQATTKQGYRCSRIQAPDSDYCRQHSLT